jgi:hypothetical protein
VTTAARAATTNLDKYALDIDALLETAPGHPRTSDVEKLAGGSVNTAGRTGPPAW